MNPRDIGAAVHTRIGAVNGSVTAGGSGDDTYRNGPTIDLVGDYNPGNRPQSGKAVVAFNGSVNTAETCTLTAIIQSSDDSNFVTGVEELANVAQVFPASADSGIMEIDVDLTGAARYNRIRLKANLSRADTDAVVTWAMWVLGGQAHEPQATFGAGVEV